MNLKLEKPIIFFDLETTGLDIAKDRIVEMSALKIFPDKNQENKTWLINPTIPISLESYKIHGISDEKISNEPTFQELAVEISDFFGNYDLAGYNSNKFDVPLLVEEFLRTNVDFDIKNRKLIDVQNIFHKLEKRTLAAAYQFYCNKELINSHSAEADTNATYEVLLSQLNKYTDLENNVSFLSEFSQREGKFADIAGFVRYNNDGKEVLSFGKYKNVSLEKIWAENPGYFSWIHQADFPLYTKNIIKNLLTKIKLEDKFN